MCACVRACMRARVCVNENFSPYEYKEYKYFNPNGPIPSCSVAAVKAETQRIHLSLKIA